jgi:hydrocephalus-inducing protein
VNFELERRELYGLEFIFDPESGSVSANGKMPIRLKFIANEVTSFQETFVFRIPGVLLGVDPTLTVSGRVIGPAYSVSTREIDFGKVSCGTINRRNFFVENPGEIPFFYNLQMSGDGSFAHREFNIEPCAGLLDKNSKQEVVVEFIPAAEGEVNYSIFLNIEKVGHQLATIRVKASVISPLISVMNEPSVSHEEEVYSDPAFSSREIQEDLNGLDSRSSSKLEKQVVQKATHHYGTGVVVNPMADLGIVYIGAETPHILKVQNMNETVANFDFLPPHDTREVDVIPVRKSEAVPPFSVLDFPVKVIAKVLGDFISDFRLQVTGTQNFVYFSVCGISRGPLLSFSEKAIDFGKIKVLDRFERILKVENKSPIPAVFQLTMESETPENFDIQPRQGEIRDSMDFVVSATCDDMKAFLALVKFRCDYLDPIFIPIRATGKGIPIIASIPLETVRFGDILTELPHTITFTVHNAGLRSCTLQISMQRAKTNPLLESSDVKFDVEPRAAALGPEEIVTFSMTVSCAKPGLFETTFQCSATLGTTRMTIFSPVVTGQFVAPKLAFSEKSIMFTHFHDWKSEEIDSDGLKIDGEIGPSPSLLPCQSKVIDVINCTVIPVLVDAILASPFRLSQTRFELRPNERFAFEVTFDPTFKQDFVSERIDKQLVFCHGKHSKKFSVVISAEVKFPNLKFSLPPLIDFGILLVDTERTKELQITGVDCPEIEWNWELIPKTQDRSVAQIFDVYPIRGSVSQNQKGSAHIVFFAAAGSDGNGMRHLGSAICHVHGGPDYVFNIQGVSSRVEFRITPRELDFGPQYFLQNLSACLTLTNLSKDPLSFEQVERRRCSLKSLTVSPDRLIIPNGGSAKMNVALVAGLPKHYSERIVISVANIQEIEIPINIIGLFPQIEMSLNRFETDKSLIWFKEAVAMATEQQLRNPNFEIPQYSEVLLRQAESRDYMASLTESKYIAAAKPKSRINKRKNKEGGYYEGYILARYVVEFGEIVLGENKMVEFTLKNVIAYPISGTVIETQLLGSGFEFVPNSFKDLSPDSVVNMNIIFSTEKRTNSDVGEVCYELPLELLDGFAVIIHLKAFIEEPVLTISQSVFRFSSVIIGQFLTMYVQLQNINIVTCDYKIKAPRFVGDQKPGPNVLQISPSNGTLPPDPFRTLS